LEKIQEGEEDATHHFEWIGEKIGVFSKEGVRERGKVE